MNDFKFMDDVVTEICKSMREDPNRWKISTHTTKDMISGIEYWTSEPRQRIHSVWTGSSIERVFSNEQSKLLVEAFADLRKIKESQAQKKIMNSFKPLPTFTLLPIETKKWWQFWK